ncbi:MAG: hypothetical protein ABI205_10400 [Gemmatimonadaceae bacterium]
MDQLARAATDTHVRIYFAGGTSAVLLGWRASTIDVDMAMRPDADDVFRAIPDIKQALAKIERSHHQDVIDVRAMIDSGLVEPARLRTFFDVIEPQLYRFPAIDPPTFKRAVEQIAGGAA